MTYLGRGKGTGSCLGRRLGFERLEQRDLLAVMRLVSWNSLNGPNDEIGDANFQTVFDAIGNETVAGNTKRVDILALQETDPAGSGGNSIGRIETILNTLYPTTNYASVITSEDGGGDSTGFVYDTSTVSLLESIEVEPDTLTHHVLRGKFRPSDTLGESDFYVYSLHLKSGNTALDESTRAFEATVLRNNADALGEGVHVLFVGDFNMKSSLEGAWTNFMVSGAGQVQDVANAPGDWFDNPAFKILHTQDPQAAMDDRLDLQLASGEFFNGVGLEYVDESFHVFGNNGTHTFDMPITTGTGASPAVLAALATTSDHLPIVADYEVLASTPKVRIAETGAGTKATEGGQFDTYSVVLDTIPAANVTVTVIPDAQMDVGNGSGVPRVLTFTPENAQTPQTVVVNAVDDLVGEGNHTGFVTHLAVSADAAYNGLEIADVAAMIVDNDAPTIVINEIDVDQDGVDSMEFVELYDGGVGNASLSGVSVVFFNGNSPLDAAYAVFNLAGQFTDSNGFFVLGNITVAGVNLAFTNNTLQNGADAVALYAGIFLVGTSPTTVNLLDAIVYDTGEADDAGLLILLEAGQPQVNENQNSAGTTQSLSRAPDGGPPRQTATYNAQAPTAGALNLAQTPGVSIVHSGTRVDIEEGGETDSYQIVLQTVPAADVTITVDPDEQSDLGAGAGVAIVLTFTPATALIPQLVEVAAVDDAAAEGVHTSVITHTAASADSGYNGIAIANVVANVLDNDAPAATSIVISEIMYNPASDETSPGIAEWIELINTGTTAIDLGGWMLDDEDGANWGAIPAGTILSAGQIAVFFDSAFTTEETFRTEWSVPAAALVVGIPWASLSNDPSPTNENLELRDNAATLMDVVNYDDAIPWPAGANGPSIFLTNLAADNDDGANWGSSAAGAGGTVSPAGPTFSTADIGSPGRFFLPGDYNVNGVVDAADYVLWRKTQGSTTDLRADGSGASVGVPDGVVDQLDYIYWMANFGYVGVPGVAGAGSRSDGEHRADEETSAPLVVVMQALSAAAPTDAEAENELAVDVAVIDFASVAPQSTLATAREKTVKLRASAIAGRSTDLLLVVDDLSLKAPSRVDSVDALAGSSDEDARAIDDVFSATESWVVGQFAEKV